MAHDVFISYSTKDKVVADAVCASLEAKKVRCWITPRDILPGEDWAKAIEAAITKSKLMILIFSSYSNDSEQVSREVALSFNSGVTVIPFRIEDIQPTDAMRFLLVNTHWLDALTPPIERYIKNLVQTALSFISNEKIIEEEKLEVDKTQDVSKFRTRKSKSYDKEIKSFDDKTSRIHKDVTQEDKIKIIVKAIEKWAYYNIIISLLLYFAFFSRIYFHQLTYLSYVDPSYYSANPLYSEAFAFLSAFSIVIVLFLLLLKGIKLYQKYLLTLIRVLLIFPLIEIIIIIMVLGWPSLLTIGIVLTSLVFIVRIVFIFYFWPKLHNLIVVRYLNPKFRIKALKYIKKGIIFFIVALAVTSIIIIALGKYLERVSEGVTIESEPAAEIEPDIATIENRFNEDTLIFEFDDPASFISTDTDNFYIENSKAVLNLDRNRNQVLYTDIPNIRSEFVINIVVILMNTTNNCEMDIGVCDSDPSSGNIINGIGVRFGWRGGDIEHEIGSYISSNWYINGVGTFAQLTERIWVKENAWYSIKITVDDDSIMLQVYDDKNSIVEEVTSTFIPQKFDYSYLYIANFDADDYPTGLSYVDYIGISSIENIKDSTDKTALDKTVVFYSDLSGNIDIYTMNPDGSNLVNLTSDNSRGDKMPRWSPDKKKIAFESNRDGDYEIYVMDASGLNVVKLTDKYNGQPGNYSWSPDSKKIVFATDYYGNYEIYTINSDGKDLKLLTDNDINGYRATWSPNGTKIAFLSDDYHEGVYEIYTMNPDGSNIVQLTFHSDDGVKLYSWSPDGTKIAFTSGDYKIYTMDPDGSNILQLTNNDLNEYGVVWSPDGKKIAFYSDRDGDYDIYTMDPDGSNLLQLTNNDLNEYGVVWSPDGTKILIISDIDGDPEIYIVDNSGENQVQLSDNDSNDFGIDW